MTVSLPRARRTVEARRPALPQPAPDQPPVFVDDSGRRRIGMRCLWFFALVATVGFFASAVVAATMSGAPPDAAASGTAVDRGPYGVLAHGFGLRPATSDAVAGCSSVSGVVFLDWDLNGVRLVSDEGSEIGVEGIDVRAFDSAGAEVARAVTGDDGRFVLRLPRAAPVRVEFSSPSRGFIESPLGTQSGSSTQFPKSPGCDASLGVVWRHSATAPDAKSDRQGVGQVSGWVWNDADCDGVIDPGESGGTGLPVDLRDPLTGEVLAATSTVDGAYLFAGLREAVRYEVAFPEGDTTDVASTPGATTSVAPADESSPADLGVVVSRMDGSRLQYLGLGDRVVARFSFEEQGESRHGVNIGLPPEGGCPGARAA